MSYSVSTLCQVHSADFDWWGNKQRGYITRWCNKKTRIKHLARRSVVRSLSEEDYLSRTNERIHRRKKMDADWLWIVDRAKPDVDIINRLTYLLLFEWSRRKEVLFCFFRNGASLLQSSNEDQQTRERRERERLATREKSWRVPGSQREGQLSAFYRTSHTFTAPGALIHFALCVYATACVCRFPYKHTVMRTGSPSGCLSCCAQQLSALALAQPNYNVHLSVHIMIFLLLCRDKCIEGKQVASLLFKIDRIRFDKKQQSRTYRFIQSMIESRSEKHRRLAQRGTGASTTKVEMPQQ